MKQIGGEAGTVASAPPQNPDAELSVLGALLRSAEEGTGERRLADVRAAGLVSADFFFPFNGRVFRALIDAAGAGEPLDAVSVAHRLNGDEVFEEKGGRDALVSLARSVAAVGNVVHHARIVHELAEKRADWKPTPAGEADQHSWTPLDLVELGSQPPTPPDVAGLFYSGKRNLLSGEYETGKSWLLLAAGADELRAGRGVVWVDTDDMGPRAVLERLRALGASDDEIRRLFAYLRPSEALTPRARDDVLRLLRDRNVRLLAVDAFNSALTLHGLDAKSTNDIDLFYAGVIDPFKHAGVAPVITDHVVKDKEARGSYSYGSERKASGCDVHIGLTKVSPFSRGRVGKAKLTVHKDRPGFLTRPSPGLFVLTSDPETQAASWTVEEDTTAVTSEGEFRPTVLMERVSRHLEIVGEPRSRTDIETGVQGKVPHLRTAMDVLVREGFASEVDGPRGARPLRSERPFRKDEDEVRTRS